MKWPRRSRLSLVQQLVLMLVGAVLLAVTVLGGFVAWNLRSGFTDYLRAQDEHWLERFVDVAAVAVAERGLAAIAGPPGALRPLFDALAPNDGSVPPPGAAEGPLRRPGANGRPPPGPQRNPNRLSIVDPMGRPLAGRSISAAEVSAERPIVVDGRVVAQARLAKAPFTTREVDANFLARQYGGIVWSALLLVLVAAVGAWWAGRRWVQPLREAQEAARRVAQGEFDVRLRVQGRRELADLAEDINGMAASLQKLEASRRRWMAELSHEMRTPLAVLRGEVEALVDGVRPLTPQALGSLQEEVARVTRLVEDFHLLALSDLRALPCTFGPVPPANLLQHAVARLQGRIAASGLTVEVDVSEAPALAHWDHQRLAQLLDNLLVNSLRYTDAPGRVVLRLQTVAGDQARLTVMDSAPGVREADLPRLFDPLFRGDASRSRRSGGSGLGLSICLAIVRSHGGHIAASMSPLGGLQMVVTLPLLPEVGHA